MTNKELLSENNKFQRLMNMADLGWWEADFKNRIYTCSVFVADLLGLEKNEIGFSDFRELIREDYRARIITEFDSIGESDVCEQTFPVYSKNGITWIHSKLGIKETDDSGNVTALGFLQCVDNPEEANTEEVAVQHVNNLLYQLNSISHSLLLFLQNEDIAEIINKMLSDILLQFKGGRTYIIEYDSEAQTHSCTYEVVEDETWREKKNIQQLSAATISWWTKQMSVSKPVILSNLEQLPAEAENEKALFESQHIKSMMAVPLVSRDLVWGCLGIDMVDNYRSWSNEDYQWFSSLANIISICMELRKSEIEAQKERSYLQNLYKYMPVGYAQFKLIYENEIPVDYIFMDTNDTAERLLGTPCSDYIHKRGSELGFDVVPDIIAMKEIVNTNKYKEHNHCIPKQNKYCHSVLYSPRKDEIVSLFTDYTETYIAHQALDKSEKILRNIYKNLPVGVELYDEDGYLVNINDKEIEIFGLESREAVLGLNLFDNPVIPAELKDKLRKHENIDFSLNYDFTKLKDYLKSGSKRRFNLITKATCLYDKQDHFLNYMFINIDNSETSNAYSRIQEFEEFFSVIADFATIGYYKWNPLTREGFAITQWFKNLDESEHAKLEEVAGIYRNMHPDDREVLQNFYEEVIAGKTKNIRKEVRIVLKDGSWRWLRCYIAVNEYDPENNIIEMIGVNYDITELKQVEEKLIIAKNKAETLDRLKSAFLANMSHEIRTPLNAIVGFSNLLVDSEDLEERKQYISIVQENNDLLLQLISDILDLSKIEAGTFDFVRGYVDINLLCTEIVCSLGLKAPPHVKVVFEEYMPECYIYSDKNRLTQVLTNFINNALKFTPKGSISLGYRRTKNDEIEFFVQDTGIGIPPEKIGTIFDRFVKLNSFVHGTGLGLPICKSIVEQMGGHIGVESEVGIGSRFWFTHPYDKTLTYTRILEENLKSKANDASSKQAPVVTSDYKPTVLIAEDTDSNYLLISTILKKDYKLVRAHNGVEAIDLFNKVNPEIILMDVKMPEMDGIEATIKIREADKDIPIIAVTAFAFDHDRQRSINAGCNDYLFKPVSGYALKTLINKYLCNK